MKRQLCAMILAASVAWVAAAAPAQAAPRAVPAPPTKEQLEQKIRFARMLTEQSKLAYRLSHAGPKGKERLTVAQGRVKAAQAALDAGDLGGAAAAADQALQTMTAAARSLPARSADDYALHYKELTDALATYKDAYDRNYKRMTAAKGKDAVGEPLDRAEYAAMLTAAKTSADGGDLAKADRILETAQRRITKALTVLLKGQTIVYDKHFDSPKQEYSYERARNKSYADLVPKALAEHNPDAHAVAMIHQFVDQSASMHDKADRQAQAGRYRDAVHTLKLATSQLQRALWVAGVRWGRWSE